MSKIRILLAIGALNAAACSGNGNAAPQGGGGGPPPGMPVKLATLSPTQISDTTEYIGTLTSQRQITVQPQVDGQITKIFVKSGDRVEAGKPIMQIDPQRQQAQVTSAQANRASRLAALAFAKQQLERTKGLYESGAASKQDLD